jgi:pre-mRNA-splicing factor 38A
MANLTDPLITSIQGTDPQNLMEYITRQKIYDCRFWKEECFGLTAADVLERAASSLKCIGGTFGGNQQPTKFLCLTLKLLQLQPEDELIQEFISQDHFKYARALGAFYLRLTGRPADIYQTLEPFYADFAKLKCRQSTEWKIVYMDELIHELLSTANSCGITLPRLPFRETLQQEGFLQDGPRPTGLREVVQEAGGLEEYLKYKVDVQNSAVAIALYEKRSEGKHSKRGSKEKSKSPTTTTSPDADADRRPQEETPEDGEVDIHDGETRQVDRTKGQVDQEGDTSTKRKSKDGRGYAESTNKKARKQKFGTLFKDKESRSSNKRKEELPPPSNRKPEEGSDEYWNEQRAKLGLKPLKK